MPIYSIQAPNGKTYQIEGPAGASQEQVIAEVLRQNPDAGQAAPLTPEVGMLGRGARGLESLLSSQRTAVESLGGGTDAALRGLERGEEIQKKYPGMDDWEAVSKTYKEKGLLPAAGEFISRVPGALAEQAPQIAESAAAARIGAAAGPYGAAAGAFAPSFTQQYGAFLERQADAQREAGQPVDVSRVKAGLTAVPAALIDTAATYFPMGKGIVKSVLGKDVADLLFKGATKEAELAAAKKISSEGFLKTAGKGLAIGAGVEIPGEVTQQMLERLQAGLPLLNDDALSEYGKTAFSTSMLAPMGAAGRFSEKSGAKQLLADEEAKKQREERRLAEAEETARKQTPEYAFEVEKKYLDLEKQRNELKAQKLKIDEASATVAADKAFNKDLDRKIEELGRNEIAPAAKEYNTVKPLLDTIRKKAELEKISPEDAMLSHLGITMPAATTKTATPAPLRVDEYGRVTSEVPTAEQNPVATYAQEQVQAARESGQLTLPDMADYLMQDPKMAAQVAAQRPALPGFSNKELTALYGGVKLRLADIEKQGLAGAKAELAQRQTDLAGQKLTEPQDQMAMYKASEEQVAEHAKTAETNFDYLDPIFEKALGGKAPVVAVNPEVKPDDKAPALRARIDKITEDIAQAERDERQARSMKENAAATEAAARREESRRQLDSLATDGGIYAQTLIPLRQKQDEALTLLEETTQRLKADETLGTDEQGKMATATRESLGTRAANLRAEFIKSSLEEAALHRRAAGKPALTQDEAIGAASKLYDTVNDWVDRAATQYQPAQYEEQIVEPAQMRANKIVRPAVTKRVEIAPAVQGISPAEVKHFKARIAAVRNQLSELPSAATRVEPLLRTQFATTEAAKTAEARGETAGSLAGELRRRTEYVRNKMAKMKGMRPMASAALNKAADVMDSGKASREVLDKVESLVDAINGGLQVRQVDIQALNDALAASTPTAIEQREAGQQAMFPALDKELGHIRATAKNFQNSPAVRKARMALDLAKEFEKKEAVRKEAAVKAEVAKREKRINELEEQIDEAKGDYAAAFGDALYEARRKAREARDAVLDPLIAKTQKEIDEAQKGLEVALKENATTMERLNYLTSLKQGARSNARAKMTTYQLLRVEEQKSLIEDFKKQLEEAQKTLDTAVAERLSEMDSADFAVEAVLDGNVKLERKHWLKLEKRLADLKKVESPANLAESIVAQQELRAQEAAVLAAEKKRVEELDRAKRQRDALEARLQKGEGVFVTRDKNGIITKVEKKGLTGMRVIEGRKEPLVSDEDKYNERLREQAMQQLIDQEELAQRRDIRDKQRESLEAEAEELYKELATYAGPTDVTEINAAIANMKTTREERANLKEKLEVWKEIQSVEAQIDALIEGKPRRKQAAATVETTAKQSANKGFRSASDEARALRKAQEQSEGSSRRSKKLEEVDFEEVDNTAENLADFDFLPLQDTLFRTQTRAGAGMNEQAVARLADRIMEGWEVVPPIKVVANESQLPQNIQDQIKRDKMAGRVPGLYDTTTGNVYLVASNLHNGNDVALTVVHEVVGHFGMRSMLGDKYTSTMNGIYDGNAAVRREADNKMDQNPNLSREVAVEEVLAEKSEEGKLAGSPFANAVRRVMYAIKQWLASKFNVKNVSDAEVEQIVANARRFVKKGKGGQGGLIDTSGALYRVEASYIDDDARDAGESIDKYVAKNKGTWERVTAAAGGFLGLETQLVDRFAPLERISKTMNALKGSQMMYYLRMYDQRMHFVAQAVGNGALARVEKTRKDGEKEYVIESRPGASIKGVVQILKDAQPYVGNGEAVNRMFTAYMSAIRADSKGFASLSFSKDVTEQDLRKAQKFVEGNRELKAIFDDARREYNDYNRDMMEFLASTGAISEQTRKELTKENDYIPWYRESNGVAELMIGGESRIRIGSIAEQPYLHELVGGDKPILDFMTSSVQNTNMLVDMGLRNLATKKAVFELVDLKMAKIVGASQGSDIVKFKVDGEDKYAAVDGTEGVPGDLIVKGMAGIPTQMPLAFRILGMPSRLLRKAVTLTPMYAAKQLFRDSLAAPILSGANFTPVLGALKEIGKPTKEILERRGIVGGQQFSGNNEDLSMILREITDGKPGWQSALAKAEAIGMEADALTRRAQYNSYIEQGLSEMEATLMALESMNFSKRGASPSMHIAASMIPFFNSQIQGLNVLYKAMTGNMPFNERLKIQEKMLQRGAMMAVGTLAYAAMMQDDEAYQNANPDQKYGNWFVRIPGVEEAVRIPVPFEIGYIFKALPEALYNTMVNEHGDEEAVKAFRHILLQTIPGGGSMPTIGGVPIPIPIPQAVKPAIEAALGKSFFTERDILSAHEQALIPEEQFRVNTSEAAKMAGRITGTSPVILEHLVNGYTGAMGLAFLQAVSLGIPKGNTPEQATKRLSELPVIGGAFQPNDAGGIVNATYDRFRDAVKIQRTVDSMMEAGRIADAKELLQKTGNEYAVGEVGDFFTSQMKELVQYERAIQAMDMPASEKRELLDNIKKIKRSLALTTRQTAEQIARQ